MHDFEKFIFSDEKAYCPNVKFNSSYEYLMLYFETEIEKQHSYSCEYIKYVESIKKSEIKFRRR